MKQTLTTEAMQEIYEAAVHEEATGGDQDAGFELLCKLEDVGGTGATIRKLIDMVRAANREAQPVGYIAEVSGNRVGVLRGLPMPDVGSLIYTSPPAPAVPEGVMPDGLVYSSALPEFESNDSDKVIGYHCFISGKTRSVESQEQAYADAKDVINACRAAMLAAALTQGENQ